MDRQEKPIRVGSRKSELALIQTKHVIGRLQKLYPKKKFEIHTMSTIGDRVLNVSLPKIGEKSLFTRDLEDALRTGGVDFVVHSLKDLPTALPAGMAIGAVLERDDARDALVLNHKYKGHTIGTLPHGSVIGTSSLRRTAQIRRQYPHLEVCDIRGNLNTRLAKLDAPDSKFAGIVLAQAGLLRMGWQSRISQVLDPVDLLYAVGQGALAVECRSNDDHILSMLQKLMCLTTSCRILAERSFLKTLGGGCSAPVAVQSTVKGSIYDPNNDNSVPNLHLTGAVWSLDGSTEIRDEQLCSLKVQKSRSAKSEHNEEINDEPPTKRARKSDSASPDNARRDSPPVINDDVDDDISKSYNFDELIEKHAQLAKRCPFLGAVDTNNAAPGVGGGDADNVKAGCPLKVEIGQDFMGQCPFVSNESKVTAARSGNCPLTYGKIESVGDSNDVTDHVTPSTSKCPFTSLHNNNNNNKTDSETKTLEKCPFLQKAVKMFDYADEEKPQSSEVPILIEDVDNLFCGLFRHACFERDLFVRSNKLGQQLAEELIKKGALEIMKRAQAEIHSKV